jgi:hypothetical protein
MTTKAATVIIKCVGEIKLSQYKIYEKHYESDAIIAGFIFDLGAKELKRITDEMIEANKAKAKSGEQ